MNGRTRVKPIDGTEDVPLPGFYQCVTTQLNITAYRHGEAGRFVICTRFPEDNVELKRDFQDVQPWFISKQSLMQAMSNHLLDVEYLMSFKPQR